MKEPKHTGSVLRKQLNIKNYGAWKVQVSSKSAKELKVMSLTLVSCPWCFNISLLGC